MLWLKGSSNFGALLAGGGRLGWSSGTPKEMISTMLETSFLTRSGRVFGRSLPVNRRLHRYIARANSGKSSCPDLVVSERVLVSSATDHASCRQTYQMWDSASPGSLERSSRSRAWSPDIACAVPTADLNSCSNFAWSCAVMKDSLIFGILLVFAGTGGGAGCDEPVDLNESAICDDVMPVGCGRCGCAGGCCGGGMPV